MPLDENSCPELILACEDFPDEEFSQYHCFFKYEETILSQLIAHGPVLLKGGRGSGKSALLREADRRLNEDSKSPACGVYLSLRHLPLLRTKGAEYEHEFLRILVDRIQKIARQNFGFVFSSNLDVYSVQQEINRFSEQINKRIVLFFDDAAHIGRETGLQEFFDIFRTLSNNHVSCKAAIYPGVTKFGTRFDIYNDAKVIDISRRKEQSDFSKFFYEVMNTRFKDKMNKDYFSTSLSPQDVANFMGIVVLGNVRSFIQGCSMLFEREEKISLTAISETLLDLSRSFFWPMLEDIETKIGMYAPLKDTYIELAEKIYSECGSKLSTSCIIHRNLVSKFAKPLEILEYAGFIAKREASRSMKSGGRGTRYALNLCNTLEKVTGSRLTQSLYSDWIESTAEDVQFAETSSALNDIIVFDTDPTKDMDILSMDIDHLRKSRLFPLGLTDDKIFRLEEVGLEKVGQLAEKTKDELEQIFMIGPKTADRIRNTVEQAIWM